MAPINIPVTTTGANGSAQGEAVANRVIEGFLTSIRVQSSGVPTTSDITISEEQPDGNFITVVTLSDVPSQVRRDIQVATYKGDGSASGQHAYPHIIGRLRVQIAQANAGSINVVLGMLDI